MENQNVFAEIFVCHRDFRKRTDVPVWQVKILKKHGISRMTRSRNYRINDKDFGIYEVFRKNRHPTKSLQNAQFSHMQKSLS